MSVGKGKVGDKVDRELLERKRRGGFDGRERWDHRVCMGFVLLANSTASNKVINKHRKSRLPEVAFNNGLSLETSKVAQKGRGMDRVEERGAGGRRYVHSTLVV